MAGRVYVIKWLCDVLNISSPGRISWQLAAACSRGDLTAAMQLVETAGLNASDVVSHALKFACHNSRDNVIRWLMALPTIDLSLCAVEKALDGESTLLIWACHKDRMDIVSRLLPHSTAQTLNTASVRSCDTAMHLIIWKHSRGNTPLHTACLKGKAMLYVQLILILY